MNFTLPGAVQPSLVELAVDVIKDQIEAQFNANLSSVSDQYTEDGRKISLEKVQPNNIYISEASHPFKLPACFIIASDSAHNLEAQNWADQTHSIMVAVLVEDLQAESTRITRKTWRYARAMWLTLHDKYLGGSSREVYVLVESIVYSPIFQAGAGGDRKFRKDATLKLRVKHLEPF